MTNEKKDIFAEYFIQEGGSDSDGPTPIKVLEETGFLEDPLGEILLQIYTEGMMSLSEVAEQIDIPKSQAKKNLGELRLQGYLDVEFESGEKFYYVDSKWDSEEFPSGPVIPLVYQYNLLSDEQRLSAIKRAIDNEISKGDVVADLGAGVGILSFLASRNAKKVYAVEMDREVFEKGKKIMNQENVDNVEYIRADARSVDISENVDVVLCEMLDTALAAELQVPVMNYAINEITRDNPTVIPSEARTSATLVCSDYEFYGGTFRLPHFEEYGSRASTKISDEYVYHEVDFTEENTELVEQRISLTANDSGQVNGIQLNTDVKFGSNSEYTGASPWLNAPLNLPFDSSYQVESGEEIQVEVSYQLGGGLNNISYEVINKDE